MVCSVALVHCIASCYWKDIFLCPLRKAMTLLFVIFVFVTLVCILIWAEFSFPCILGTMIYDVKFFSSRKLSLAFDNIKRSLTFPFPWKDCPYLHAKASFLPDHINFLILMTSWPGIIFTSMTLTVSSREPVQIPLCSLTFSTHHWSQTFKFSSYHRNTWKYQIILKIIMNVSLLSMTQIPSSFHTTITILLREDCVLGMHMCL